MIRISRAIKKDLREVARLRFLAQKYSRSFDSEVVVSKKTKEQLKRLTKKEFEDPRIVYLLARENGQACGLAILSLSPQTDKTAFLGELFVEDKYRNKGIGRRLIKKAMELAIKKGIRKLRVTVGRRNIPAQKFYRQLGFSPKKREYLLFEKDL